MAIEWAPACTEICYLHQDPVPAITPSALQLLQMVDGFGCSGAATTLIAPYSLLMPETVLGHALSPNVTLVPIPDLRKRWYFPFATYRLVQLAIQRRLARRRRPHVYVRNLKLAERILLAFPELPVFFETHELFAASFSESNPHPTSTRAAAKLRELERREGFVYGKATGIVALTQSLADDIQTRYGLNTPLLVAHDAVDATAITARPIETTVGEHEPICLYLGSLHPWKGVDTLVDALPYCQHGTLWVAGGRPEEVMRLEQRAAALGVASRMRCLGHVSPADRFGVIAQATLCLLPSSATQIGSRYTSPLKLFEYLALGKPIITADLPALREIVAAGENALLVPVGDARAMAAAIDHLLTNPTLVRHMSEANLRLAASHTWQKRAERILGFIAATANGKESHDA